MRTVAMDGSASEVAVVILGGAVIAIVVALAWQYYQKRQHEARRASATAVSEDGRLSRSSSAAVTDPITFGGGAMSAAPTNRRETVAYGYLGVGEEYVGLETNSAWSVLSLSLPGWLPYLVVDRRTAMGRPGIPAAAGHEMATGDAAFDEEFVVISAEQAVVDRVLTPDVRALLAHFPLQRVSLSGKTMLLRTFDDNHLTDTVLQGLDLAATELLSTAPSFVMEKRPSLGQLLESLPTGADTLPQGFYGAASS